ncbi:YkvA family protein [Hamadaea tsunoensis]|uniref:YkvA family protein n=1 Tax=Hamadaea tsunoensis TaxID=53368 RepID=UPI0004190010|nr:YkvA family protein [Hamadaea tsunoensis]
MSRQAWIVLGVIAALVAVVTLIGAIRLIVRLVGVKRALGAAGTGGKVAFWGALAYTIFPIDILPDPIYLDDMAVLGGALFYLTKLLRSQKMQEQVIPKARAAARDALERRRGR